jgi:hypothetical protein
MVKLCVTNIASMGCDNQDVCGGVTEKKILHFSGMNFNELSRCFRIGRSTISEFVPEVLQAIYAVLQPTYMKVCKTFFIFQIDPPGTVFLFVKQILRE